MSQLNAEEIRLLAPCIRGLEKLELGERKPKTFLQSQFLSVCKGDIPARTKYERAYLKWRKTRPSLSKTKQGRTFTNFPKKVLLKKETDRTLKIKRIEHERRCKIELNKIARQVERRDAADRGQQILKKDNTPNRRINQRRKNAKDKSAPKRKSSPLLTGSPVLPRVVGEPSIFGITYPKSRIRQFADENRSKMTEAENRLKSILNAVNGGALRERFKSQHVISGKWIVDFFFPEVRMAIEVDGGSHLEPERAIKDIQKETDCARFDITLVRVRNSDVFGDRELLLETLRAGWSKAKKRENKVIGNVAR